MSNWRITDTTGRTKYKIMPAVIAQATKLTYGALLGGSGTIWFDDTKFGIAENSTRATGKNMQTPDKPTNLNFEEQETQKPFSSSKVCFTIYPR